jgi:hypothetical protein
VIADLINKVKSYRKAAKTAADVANTGQETVQEGLAWTVIEGRLTALRDLVGSIRNLREIIKNTPPSIKPIEESRDAYRRLRERRETLARYVDIMKTRKEVAECARNEAKELEAKLQTLACPLCGRKG